MIHGLLNNRNYIDLFSRQYPSLYNFNRKNCQCWITFFWIFSPFPLVKTSDAIATLATFSELERCFFQTTMNVLRFPRRKIILYVCLDCRVNVSFDQRISPLNVLNYWYQSGQVSMPPVQWTSHLTSVNKIHQKAWSFCHIHPILGIFLPFR